MTDVNYNNDPELLDELFEERAAILEYDANFSRDQAEQRAANAYGFVSKDALKAYVNSPTKERKQDG